MNSEALIAVALEEAKKAFTVGEVPIGAVIASKGVIIAASHNLIETTKSSCAHAEMLAIQQASSKLGRWRLEDCILAVTLEPCPMCMSAIRLARISKVVFGATDSRYGYSSHAPTLADSGSFGIPPSVLGGILKEECATLLQEFFKLRR